MPVTVQTVLDDRIARYVNHLKEDRHATEVAVVRELVEGGYAQIIQELHSRYQRGEITFRTMADELGLSVRDLYDMLEQKGLPT